MSFFISKRNADVLLDKGSDKGVGYRLGAKSLRPDKRFPLWLRTSRRGPLLVPIAGLLESDDKAGRRSTKLARRCLPEHEEAVAFVAYLKVKLVNENLPEMLVLARA